MRFFALLMLVLCPPFCLADTIVFKNGRELAGKVLEQDETSMLIEVEYGTIRVSKDLIERVDPDTPEVLAKREAARQAREKAEAERAAVRAMERELKATVAAKAKEKAQAQNKAKPAAAAKQQNPQQDQPRWSDQYINWRRTMRTGNTTAPGGYQRTPRNPYTGSQGAARARMPFNPNQLPNGIPDMARKYLGGRGR